MITSNLETIGCLTLDIKYRTMRPNCSFSRTSALNKTERCFEVALKDNLISCAISPTDAVLTRLKYFKIAMRRLLANAFKTFSSSLSFIKGLYHNIYYGTIRTNKILDWWG